MEQSINKKDLITRPIFILGVFIVVFIAGSSFATHNSNKEIGEMVNNSLNGNFDPKNKGYDRVLAEIFAYYKDSNNVFFPYTTKLSTSDVLEFSSYKTKNDLIRTMDNLKGSIEELRNHDNNFAKLTSGAKDIIFKSSLSDKEKQDMLIGFEKGYQGNKELRQNKALAQAVFYEKVLSLYEFLLANFDDYQIKSTDGGEESIYFYTDRNITRYNQIYSEVQTLAQSYVKAENALKENLDNKNSGVSSQAVENYFNK
jgi:hypothetical protein